MSPYTYKYIIRGEGSCIELPPRSVSDTGLLAVTDV